MISFQEVAVLDRNSEYRGVPPERLMENAGRGLAEEIHERYPDRDIICVCGTGNNGGDAYVCARYLSEWKEEGEVSVFLLKGRENVRSQIARENLQKLEDMDCAVVDELDRESIDGEVVVDGLLGTGIKGDIREPYRSTIQAMNQHAGDIVSVDIPSGLGADMSVEPDMTVTFQYLKYGMDEENCGEIVVKDIGIPESAERYTGPGEMLLYPKAKTDSHKGENGRLLVIGGGQYTGAPALAGKAAYKAGADLVHLAVPESVKDVVAGFSPSFIVNSLEGGALERGHVDTVLDLVEDCDAVLVGPGLGGKEGTHRAVRDILEALTVPKVVDADALHALKGHLDIIDEGTILTPHQGEFRMLVGDVDDADLEEEVKDTARKTGTTFLVKGKEDIISDGERLKINDFGGPAMTVGGTGDTLSGVVGALLSKGMSPFDAARTGVFLTTWAGGLVEEEKSFGLMPEDVAEKIPEVLKDM